MIKILLRQLIRESLLLEDKIQDLVDSDTTGDLWSAREMGVTQIAGLMWLKSLIDKGLVGERGEPLADVVPAIVSFFKQGMSDRLNRAGLPADIMRYKNPGELRQTIESLGASKGAQKKAVKQDETDIIYESDNFLVVMPRSTASACFYGKGTTWCTAATEGTNLFLSYVASDRGVILYHILKKGSDSRTDAGSKINVATVKGKPYFSSQTGGLSVDAANAGLTEAKYNAALGEEAQPVLAAIVAHSAKLGNKHPAAKEVDAAVASLAAWKAKTDKYNEEIYNDFITFAFKDRMVDSDILESTLSDPRLKANSKYYIYESPNFNAEVLVNILKNAKGTDANAAITSLATKKNITYDQLMRAIEIFKPQKNSEFIIARLYQNPAIPTDALIAAYNENSNAVKTTLDYIAKNPNIPDEFIQEKIQEAVGPYKSSQPKSQLFIISIALGRPEYTRQIWDAVKDSSILTVGSTELRFKLAKSIASSTEDTQLLKEIAQLMIKYSLKRYGYEEICRGILRSVITNGATPDDVIQDLAMRTTSGTLIQMLAQARLDDPDFNEEDVAERHQEEYPDEYDDDDR